jgi:hypothetical protein
VECSIARSGQATSWGEVNMRPEQSMSNEHGFSDAAQMELSQQRDSGACYRCASYNLYLLSTTKVSCHH